MPILSAESYPKPCLIRGPHMETILPNLTRRRFRVAYQRERLELEDGDFLDLDVVRGNEGSAANAALVVLHGLEGSSGAPYVRSFAVAARSRGYDIVAMNMRGCSGELNRHARFYHSGETGDLRETLRYLSPRYQRLGLVGFSLGGNVVLKYLGENPKAVEGAVFGAIAYSTPLDLAASAARISEASNGFYMKRFIRLLSDKIERKAKLYPDSIDPRGCREMRTFFEFDGRYTAPLNRFASAEDYWRCCSSLNWLEAIRTPSLLLNARNDPFLSPSCFPESMARNSEHLYSCFPDRGGHMGFPGPRTSEAAWHERFGLDFLASFSRG